MTFIFCIAIIGVIVVFLQRFLNWYLKTTHQWLLNNIQKRLDNGKINDKQLMNLYRAAGAFRSNATGAFLLAGFQYKYFLNSQQAQYELYKAEAKKRGLL